MKSAFIIIILVSFSFAKGIGQTLLVQDSLILALSDSASIQPTSSSHSLTVDATSLVALSTIDPLDYTTGKFPVHINGKQGVFQCPPTGRGNGDQYMSLLKNRDKLAPKYNHTTAKSLIEHNLPSTGDWAVVYTKMDREGNWSAAIQKKYKALRARRL